MINGQIIAHNLVIFIHRAEYEYPPPLIKALANLATTTYVPFVCACTRLLKTRWGQERRGDFRDPFASVLNKK